MTLQSNTITGLSTVVINFAHDMQFISRLPHINFTVKADCKATSQLNQQRTKK